MSMIRLLVVVIVTLSASLSGAMDGGHAVVMEHSYAAVGEADDDQPVCCSESSERIQTCHALPALLPGADLLIADPASCEDVSVIAGVLLTGIEPSGPLDPPRAV